MKTELLTVDPKKPEPELVRRAADLLRQGKLVAFPTETVYGLGANALDEPAVRGIFAAKGRPASNPLIVHVKNIHGARELAAQWPEPAQQLAEHFWPGSLTLVVPRRDKVPEVVTAGGPTVALRVPAHPVALALIDAAGLPLAAPSANRSNRLSPTTAQHVWHDLNGRIDMILDGGPAWGGLESTVLDVTTTPPRLLRPGLISPAELEQVIGPVARPETLVDESDPKSLRSPGMLRKHYAPRAALECVPPQEGKSRAEELAAQGLRVGWLTFDPAGEPKPPSIVCIVLPREPAAYAARLYATLHHFDAAGVDCIVVDAPPETDDWLAIRDRLGRAAARC
jgi:L-threonylcarbamoyladenylate synthase